jgi:hypothetical protein
MHSLFIAWVYLFIAWLISLVATLIFKLPPKIKPLSPEEWASTAEYLRRMSRRGVFNHPKMAAVTEIGSAKEKRVLLLGPRKWESI